MIETPYPQTEQLVLFWHNHFVSAYSAINEQSTSIARQNMMFRELGIGNFKILTKAVIRDPAMLNYLDNDRSEKGKPNENLSRELMELFVLLLEAAFLMIFVPFISRQEPYQFTVLHKKLGFYCCYVIRVYGILIFKKFA